MRGEDYRSTEDEPPTAGSPPHARGRQLSYNPSGIEDRITPACAGKTTQRNRRMDGGRDHPRMRGEDGPARSSRERRPWITPACAGKTAASGCGRVFVWDHPRMRGEDFPSPSIAVFAEGSPPHARGRRLSRSRQSRKNRDHPRMRGEDRNATTPTYRKYGSPPHARGRPKIRRNKRDKGRITPACAGKTVRPRSDGFCYKDHPRMRGEDSADRLPRGRIQGSPPHARGRH